MGDLILTTYDWVPEMPRGFVRDLRVRWALEEAGLPYRVATTPFAERGADHLARQPFGQTPWLTDGDVTIFESGAILLHLAEKSPALMPRDPAGRSAVVAWIFAALNSVEMAVVPWVIAQFAEDREVTPARERLDAFFGQRLARMEAVLAPRDWLCEGFTAADILMADVLRLADRFDGLAESPACRAYVARATARPAFETALADQLAHFAAADPG